MTTPTDVAGQIVDALYLSDPELDTSIGTPLRKIIDAVSIPVAGARAGTYLTDYQYDIDSKIGGDLDDFCANFGIGRLPGARAVGTLTFSRSTEIAASTATTIPPGTQAVTGTVPSQVFQTTVSTTMDVGQASVDVPAQALQEGPDANILANTPLRLGTTVTGVTNVSNSIGFAGGSIDETDAQLRGRFKATVFRSLAGTDSMYRGVALETLASINTGSFGVAQVNILGASTHNIEQIQFVGGVATASLATAASFLTSTATLTDSVGTIVQPNVLYSMIATPSSGSTPATLTLDWLGGIPGGDPMLFTLEYDYIPLVSRNDPFNIRWSQGSVNNRVDIIVNGQVAAGATQTVHYLNTYKFNNTSGDALNRTKFVNLSGANPANNDIFIPLGFGPILTLPTPLHVSGNDYVFGTDYDIVHQDDAFGYTPSSLFGIWWKVASAQNVAHPISNGTSFDVHNVATHNSDGTTTTTGYTYNSVPASVMRNLANWRMLGTDVQVHAGKQALLALNFAIVYDRNVNSTTINTNIQSALDAYLKTLGFNAAIQISDLVQVAHNVQGVDNIRLTSSTDNATTYGVQRVQSDGTVLTTYNVSGRPTDVYFDERTYPVLYSVAFTAKARNSFRT